MTVEKNFSKPLIWDQVQRSSLIGLKVMNPIYAVKLFSIGGFWEELILRLRTWPKIIKISKELWLFERIKLRFMANFIAQFSSKLTEKNDR